MATPLHTVERDLLAGAVIERPNRFVVRVAFDGGASNSDGERVFLGDPGALRVLQPGATVLCAPAANDDRKTDYDAVAVADGDTWVSLRAAFANDLVEAALARDLLPGFGGYTQRRREPPLPDHGRSDFLLAAPDGTDVYLEVKSCTHVEDGVAKFPDRQTERGRRHLRSLIDLHGDDAACHLLFVVQRPDADALEPFRAVDPEFADLLVEARDAGVGLHAATTRFDPPAYALADPDLPIRL
ncbi:MAG: DNA/RNA nuclease SfsA [Haloferacaceae archaeon]